MLENIRMITPRELACCTEYVQVPHKELAAYLAQGWRCASFSYGFNRSGTYGERYSLVR